MIEDWIDALAKVWEIDDGAGGLVRSYRLFERQEFPETINEYPSALSYPTEVTVGIAAPQMDLWSGQTEFHLFPNTDKANLPALLRYFHRIKVAAAANLSLGGRVAHFQLSTEGPAIQGPLELSYGDGAPHHGLIVYWQVKAQDLVELGQGVNV